MTVKNCETCGCEFFAKSEKVRTCRIQCRNALISREKSDRLRRTKRCTVCGSEFSVTAPSAGKQTCSVECSYKLRGSKTSQSQKMQCGTCGVGFLVKLSQVMAVKGGGNYCSVRCLYERNRASTTRACAHCGAMFCTPPSHLHVQTCSTDCGYAYFTGARKPNYIGATRVSRGADGSKKTVQNKWYTSKKNTVRRLKETMATPLWADQMKIRDVYEMAAKMEFDTGQRYHVDHIVPLTSRLVSGLHVHQNLCVLPAAENLRKGNRQWPDMP